MFFSFEIFQQGKRNLINAFNTYLDDKILSM